MTNKTLHQKIDDCKNIIRKYGTDDGTSCLLTFADAEHPGLQLSNERWIECADIDNDGDFYVIFHDFPDVKYFSYDLNEFLVNIILDGLIRYDELCESIYGYIASDDGSDLPFFSIKKLELWISENKKWFPNKYVRIVQITLNDYLRQELIGFCNENLFDIITSDDNIVHLIDVAINGEKYKNDFDWIGFSPVLVNSKEEMIALIERALLKTNNTNHSLCSEVG